MLVLGIILGLAGGIAGTLGYQKYILGLFKKVDKAVSDVKSDLK